MGKKIINRQRLRKLRLTHWMTSKLYQKLLIRMLFTYIHNWSLQLFRQGYGLASHTIYVVCVNFIHKWRNLPLKVDSERQIFEKLFKAISFYSQSSRRNTFSYFVLMSEQGYEAWHLVGMVFRIGKTFIQEHFLEQSVPRKSFDICLHKVS